MDIKIKLTQLDIICKAFSSSSLSEDACIHFKEKNNQLEITCSDSITIVCDTSIDIPKDPDVVVNAREFTSYIFYLSGFKLGGDVVITILEDSLRVKYNESGVKNYVYMEFIDNPPPPMSVVRAVNSIELSNDAMLNSLYKAVMGTSSAVFSNAYNGIIIFKHNDTTYVSGTDSVRCVIIPTDIVLPDKIGTLYLTTLCVTCLSSIAKITGMPCVFGTNRRKFIAKIGGFSIVGPTLSKGAPVDQLLSVTGSRVVVDSGLFLNALKGSLQATKKDIYKSINISISAKGVRLKSNNFEVILPCESDVEEAISSSFNSNSLYTMCSNIKGDELTIELNSDAASVVRNEDVFAYISPVKE